MSAFRVAPLRVRAGLSGRGVAPDQVESAGWVEALVAESDYSPQANKDCIAPKARTIRPKDPRRHLADRVSHFARPAGRRA